MDMFISLLEVYFVFGVCTGTFGVLYCCLAIKPTTKEDAKDLALFFFVFFCVWPVVWWNFFFGGWVFKNLIPRLPKK